MGMNVGLSKMAESTPDISYRQMAHTTPVMRRESKEIKKSPFLKNVRYNNF